MSAKVAEKGGWRNNSRWASVVALIFFFTFAAPLSAKASARKHHRKAVAHARHLRPRAQVALYRAALLEDADTGRVLYEENAEMEWPPASMAKMMLLLVAAEQIKAGRFTINDPVRVSERAAHTGGTRLGLQEGQIYPLGELIKAALIKSANNAAVAIAEKIAGSVEACVRMMNSRALELGMRNTEYHTVDGLPPRPGHDVDRTTAHDLATVARALIHETDLLKWSSQETCPFDGGVCVLRNTNHLVGHFDGCDGLKTGFTFQAGFNLTATAKRGNLRLVSVILGAPSNQQRFAQSARLLEWGFDRYTSVAVLRSGDPLPVHVQVESGPTIQPVAAKDVNVVLPKTDVGGIHLEYRVPAAISGPVSSGERVGEVLVQARGETVAQVNALCPIAIPLEQAGTAATTWDGAAPAEYNQVNQ